MLFLVLTPVSVQAIELEGLYRASIIVTSKDDERERDRAFTAAMREVLLKVSGSSETLNPTRIRRALNRPQPYVESSVYRSIISNENTDLPAQEGAESIESIELEVSFFESEILTLLDDNELSIWPANRPATLLWLVVQEELGDPEIISSTSQTMHELMALIQLEAKQRGLPLLLPLMDLEDQQSLRADELWGLNEQAILSASERYQVESILAMRLYRSLSGELLGKSIYLFREQVQPLESFEQELDEFIESAVGLAAEELSGYYAVLLSGSSADIKVSLRIDGISNVQAYSGLLKYINSLTGVNAYQIIAVDQQNLLIELSTGGQIRQLVEIIALEKKLALVSDLNRDADGIHMHYRWEE